MKRTLDAWTAVCVAESASAAMMLAQSSINEVVRLASATVDQACSWASIANHSANAYAARLVAAATEFGLSKPYSGR
jgi:hypothetical protein